MDKSGKILIALLIATLALRISGAFLFPLWAGADEPSHLYYIEFVAEHGVPTGYDLKLLDTLANETFQPPFYYLLNSPLAGLPVFFLRLFNAVAGALMVLAVFFTAREVFDKKLALLSAAFIAFLPSHFIATSFISNSPLAWLFSVLVVWFCLRAVKRDELMSLLLAGFFFGLAVMTKSTGLMVAPCVIIAFLHFRFKIKGFLALIPGLVLFLANYARNWLVFGAFSPYSLIYPVVFNSRIFGLDFYLYFFSHFFSNFFTQEYGAATLPPARYLFFALWLALVAIAFYGLFRKRNLLKGKAVELSILVLPFVFSFGFLLYHNVFCKLEPQARWTFGSLAWIALLLFGLRKLGWKHPDLLVYVLILSFVLMDLMVFVFMNSELGIVPWVVR